MQRLILLLILVWPGLAQAQTDTLDIGLAQAEQRFVAQSLVLLAQKFNISAAKAQEVQARLYPNPNLYLENALYNGQTGRFFPLRVVDAEGNQIGNHVLQVQQLVLLAGKRNKALALARLNTELNEYLFFDLVRTLKYSLRQSFFNLYFLQRSLAVYGEEIGTLQKTVALYQLQLDKGNVPLKEVVRLKAFLFGLESERKDLAFQIATEQANFLTLLCARENAYVRPVVQKAALDSLRPAQLDFGNLLKLAQANRYDLRGLEAQTRLAQANLSYQRALAVPDLTAQFNYEATGNFANRYTGIGVGVPLPMFNRNQGNIKAAKANIDAAGATFQNAQLSVEKDVLEAWQKALYADRVYQEFDRGFEGQFDDLIGNIVTSYQRSIIGVVEFLDYYESYKNSALQRNRLQNDRMNALEQLQFAVGVPVLTY